MYVYGNFNRNYWNPQLTENSQNELQFNCVTQVNLEHRIKLR